ncbi:hypothetical protein E0L36_05585 [Streptomyces sp. AJS327]|uniref:monovalent cation/H+ antiporter complex subunit F n=1 Tax=Streptomyces sp. AJS327 TaxID=2545265 RepID=UPI0015DEE00A|nr:monovalent cation/H+ antiporter complex subunit F [Streptomyces sp. AJS327]MBA0050385.1 hypothetical protein [Streptomyces sp. AJS327]
MDVILVIVATLLIISGVLVSVRLALGPTTLDRGVALDALVAVVMAGVGVWTAAERVPYYLPVLLVLSFLGFTGSVGIARFMALRDEAGGENIDEDGAERTESPEHASGTVAGTDGSVDDPGRAL